MKQGKIFVEERVQKVLASCGIIEPPNLVHIAAQQGIRSIICCDLPAEGMIDPIPGGFQVYLRSNQYSNIDMQGSEPPLSKRDRFTLAHEIVHTFFYTSLQLDELDVSLPQKSTQLRDEEIEALCNYGAGLLLVPKEVLERRYPTTHGSISIKDIQSVTNELRVSNEVAIRRLKTHTSLTSNQSVLCLDISEEYEHWKIRVVWCGDKYLAQYLSRVKRQPFLRKWFQGLSASGLLSQAGQELTFGRHHFHFYIPHASESSRTALLCIETLSAEDQTQ